MLSGAHIRIHLFPQRQAGALGNPHLRILRSVLCFAVQGINRRPLAVDGFFAHGLAGCSPVLPVICLLLEESLSYLRG